MRHLFYTMVEMITESITGIENGAMKLGEVATYINVSRDVITVSNIIIAIMIPVCIVGVVSLYEFMSNLIEKISSHSTEENLA